MIKALLHFANDTPDRELTSVIEVVFKDGNSLWKCRDPKQPGVRTLSFKVGEIAYVQFGVK